LRLIIPEKARTAVIVHGSPWRRLTYQNNALLILAPQP
jgi:hypothetical protein